MRIFIDCSFVDFSKQPTGIPRVVANYIENGYDWAAEKGHQVIPVVCTPSGIFIVRPIPGASIPVYLHKYNTDGYNSVLLRSQQVIKKILEYGGHYLSGIAHHLIFLFYSIFRIRAIRFVFERVASIITSFAFTPYRYFEAFNTKRCKIELREDDIVFAPAYWHDVSPIIWSDIRKKCTLCILVHDILPVSAPEYYHAPWKYIFKENLKSVLGICHYIATISQYTKSEIIKYFPDESHCVQFFIAPNAYDRSLLNFNPNNVHADILKAFQKKPYLMVGSVEPKKGHIEVLRALIKARQNNKSNRKLIVVGRPGWMFEQIESELNCAITLGHAKWFKDADDNDLAYCYKNCYALIFASTAEGFGLPLVEAASFGTAIIARRTAVTTEVMSDTCSYFDNENELEWVIGNMEAQEVRDNYRQKSEEFQWPNWRDTTWLLFDKLTTLKIEKNNLKV